MAERMRASVLTQYGKLEWLEVPVPEPGPHEVLIRVSYAGICGSDQHIFSGEFHPRTHIPLIPGHEFVGRVAACGSGVCSLKAGDRVTADPIIPCGECAACALGHFPACTSLRIIGVDGDGGFAEYVKAAERMVYRVGTPIPERHAALIELLSIGFHACKRAELKAGDTAVIWGAGRVGQSVLQAARIRTAARIFIVDILGERLAIAEKSFPDVVPIDAARDNPIEVIREGTGGRGVDVAFEAVGHAREIPGRVPPARGCIQAIRGAGTVCVLGLSSEAVPLVLKELIWREARIVASRVSHGEFADVIHHMERGLLKPDMLISAEFPASRAQEAFLRLEKEPEKYLKILLNMDSPAQ